MQKLGNQRSQKCMGNKRKTRTATFTILEKSKKEKIEKEEKERNQS